MKDSDWSLVTIAFTLIIASAVWLRSVRQARNIRKREFRAFLVQWRSELSAFKPTGMGHIIFHDYQAKLPQFHAHVAQISDDFAGDKTFKRSAGRMGSLNQTEMAGQNKTPQEIILDAIDELVLFLA